LTSLLGRAGRWLPAAVAVGFSGLLPVLFIPTSVDAYILPRTVLVLVVGLAGLQLWPRLGSLRWPLVLVAAAAVASCVFSVVPALSFTGSYSRYESLPVRIAYLGLFCWGAAAAPGASRWVVPSFILGCCVAAFEAGVEWITHSLPRPDGNLGQPNLLGVLLAMAIVLAVIRALRDPRWVPAVGLLGAGILACTSRSGWLATLIGLVVAVLFSVPARHLRRVALVGAAVVGLALVVVLASPLRTLNSDPGGARIGVWADALRMGAARPLTGWGEDTMGLHFGHFQTKDWELGHSFDRAHDQPIDLFVTQGLLGLSASGLFFGIFWWGLWKRRSPALAGLAGACAAYFAWSLLNFDWAPATGAFWLLAGLAWGSEERLAAARQGVASLIGLVAGLLAGLAVGLPAQIADLAYFSGDAARAAALDPLQARYHAAAGGLAELERAAALGDTDPATYVRLGDALRAAGDARGARAAYRTALEIYPFDPTARSRYPSSSSSS